MIQKVFIRNVSWGFYAKSKFCVCFEVHIPVKRFANAKFGYRTVSNFNNTKLEKLPKVKLLKLEMSTFGLFCLFCHY